MPQIFITSGTSYQLPNDFNPGNNTVECYGGGAGGNSNRADGGGGGSYAKVTNIQIGAGETASIQIGSAGSTDTWFNATSLANAVSKGVTLACGAQGASGRTGGLASASCGTVKYNGGDGGSSSTDAPWPYSGGGGGGCAGPNGAGGAGGNADLVYNTVGGGGGGANSGGAGGNGDGYNTIGGIGGTKRGGGGSGASGYSGNINGGNGSGGGGGGGGAAGEGGYAGNGGAGSTDAIYGGSGGPGGGGGGGGAAFYTQGVGAWGGSYGSGGGGGPNGSGGGCDGLIVITYVSAPPGNVRSVPAAPILSVRAPYITQTRGLRQADLPPLRMDWFSQPTDLLKRPPSSIIHRYTGSIPQQFPNPTPLIWPPHLHQQALLRHPVTLDFRQQFPGKKPPDFSALVNEDEDTISSELDVYSPVNATLIESDEVVAIIQPAPKLGEADDIIRRVKLLLPKGWWNDVAPIRDAIIGGIADTSEWAYSLITYAKKQTRVAWATDLWLDIIAKDYFRFEFPRRINEADEGFRERIQKELIRERVTRKGMNDALVDLTGKQPVIFEPWNTGDTGVWDYGNFALDISGGWGDTILPAQSFVNVIPPGAGIPGAPGWDAPSFGWDFSGMWGDMSLIAGTITNDDIYATINKTRPTGSIVWTQLFKPEGPMPLPEEHVRTPSFAPPYMIQPVVRPGQHRYSIGAMPPGGGPKSRVLVT